MLTAYDIFQRQEESIMTLLRAADVYAQNVLAVMRKQPPNLECINGIIKNKGLSTLNLSWRFHLTPEEYKIFDDEGHTQKICQQIVFTTYTALELYLIDKYKEYLSFKLQQVQDKEIVSNIIEHLSYLRSLEDIKKAYSKYFNIYLPYFEPRLSVFEEAWFHPISCWDALNILSKVRNEIAHAGDTRKYNIIFPNDAWAPFEFTRRYVQMFNIHFDKYIYEGVLTDWVQDQLKKGYDAKAMR